ncbi:MAG TPA: T9SS type A sorting domain-containing protein [Chitinophagales bacterium]|nr:T9SS type A sorting domain-containing protein [Chitinophagales bacterium]
MKNKTQLLLAVCLTLLSPLFSISQSKDLLLHKNNALMPERVGDPYLPNADNNEKTSPVYISGSGSLRNTSIFTMQANVNASGQNILGDAANEPNIAVNPLNEDQIVIGWRQFDNVSSNFRQAGWSYTSDGGQTWTFPGVIDPGMFHSDPVLDYDTAGNFYYNSLSGNFVCQVYKSTDGGASWDAGTDAYGGDKQWMTIDRTTGVGSGNIYAFWTFVYSTCIPGFFTRSTDEGSSYEYCTEVEGYPFWGTMAVGNEGELYIAGSDTDGNVIVAKSLNAQSPDSLVSWNLPAFVFMDGYPGAGASVNPEGLLGQINIDVDRSGGAGQGNVYVLATLVRSSIGDQGDVMFAKSTDGGATWSSPIQINDDLSVTHTQWLATMSVAPNGRIDAAWLDTRDTQPFTDSSALYYSYSIDQGSTWSVNEKLSDSFDPHVGYPNQNKMGDYIDMVSGNTSAHLAWANTLNGEEDVYYSRITPDVVSSVNENPVINFSVFPNPSNGVFILTSPGFSGINSEKQSTVEICNELGEKVYSELNFSIKGPSDKTRNEIDISSQPAGIYFLKMIDQEGYLVIKKIIIE